jgi:predicted kinase
MQKPRLVLMRGLPGSGKSSFATNVPNCVILSADSFFVDDVTQEYNFNHTGLEAAHIRCQEQCRLQMKHLLDSCIVIDNCNLCAKDAAPYVQMADEFGFDVEIADVGENVSIDELAKRNVHGLSKEAIAALAEKREMYSVADARAVKLKKDSKETAALRKKWSAKVAEPQMESVPAAASVSNKVRLEVCANNGQAHPVKVLQTLTRCVVGLKI